MTAEDALTLQELDLVREILDDTHHTKDLQKKVCSRIRPNVGLTSAPVLERHETLLNRNHKKEKRKPGERRGAQLNKALVRFSCKNPQVDREQT